MSERGFPNNCPYCGDLDLWPHESSESGSGHGEWECRSCLRAFRLTMLGMVRPASDAGALGVGADVDLGVGVDGGTR